MGAAVRSERTLLSRSAPAAAQGGSSDVHEAGVGLGGDALPTRVSRLTTTMLSLSDLDALIFDFDGTLADSRIDFALLRRRALDYLRARGFDPTPVAERPVLEIRDWARGLLAAEETAAYDEEFRQVLDEVERPFAEAATPYPGVPEALARAHEAGLLLGVITRNSQRSVEIFLGRHPLPLAVVVSRDDPELTQVKPHPDHVLLALRRLEVTPPRALVVGDYPFDIECGRRAGAHTGAVLTTGQTEATFRALGADLIAPDVPTLLALLLR